jgi:hypothetical protein
LLQKGNRGRLTLSRRRLSGLLWIGLGSLHRRCGLALERLQRGWLVLSPDLTSQCCKTFFSLTTTFKKIVARVCP